MTWVAFLLSCAGAGFFLYALYDHNTIIQCTDSSGNKEPCNSFSTGTKIGATFGHILGLLYELCKPLCSHLILIGSALIILLLDFCIVIKRYVEQLEDEQSYRNEFGLNKTASYYPHQPVDTSADHGLLQPQTGAYPYTDQAHSFGPAKH
jgi:hypothetical protein